MSENEMLEEFEQAQRVEDAASITASSVQEKERVEQSEEKVEEEEELNPLETKWHEYFQKASSAVIAHNYSPRVHYSPEEMKLLFETGSIRKVRSTIDGFIKKANESRDQESEQLFKEMKLEYQCEKIDQYESLSSIDQKMLTFSIRPWDRLKMTAQELDDLTEKIFLTSVAAGMFHGDKANENDFKQHIRENLEDLNNRGLQSLLHKTSRELDTNMKQVSDQLVQSGASQKKNYSDVLAEQANEQTLQANEAKTVAELESERAGVKASMTADEIRQMVSAEAERIGFYSFNPEAFVNYYEENGWKTKKGETITDVKLQVRTWQKNSYARSSEHRKSDLEQAINTKNGEILDLSGFYPSSVEEIESYCKGNHLNEINPDRFFNTMKEHGWKDGKGEQVMEWKGLLRTQNANLLKNKQTEELKMS